MSVKTPEFKFDVPVLGEEANIPADLLSVITEVENVIKALNVKYLASAGAEDAKKLLIVQGTGAAAWKTMGGDATVSEAGVVTIGNEKISTDKLAALCVTEANIALEEIGTATLRDLAVTAAKLAAECVETGKIANLAVTAAKLATETKRLFPQLVEGLRSKDRFVNFAQEFVNAGTKEWEASHGLPGVVNHQNLQIYMGVFNNEAVPSTHDIVTVKAVTSTKITFRREGASTKTLLFWWEAVNW